MFLGLDRYERYGPLILRIGIGLTMLFSGLAKVTGLAGVTRFFAGVGIPLPGIMAPLVAFIELLGGIAMLLGLGVRVVGLLFAIIMVVAILTTKVTAPGGMTFSAVRLDLLVLTGSLALAFTGAGELSVDSLMEVRRPVRY